MTFDPNDPRLTAYVLGELDPSERPEIEAMLETSAEGRQAVEEIRQTIGWLSDHLRNEQAPTPSAPNPTTGRSSHSQRRRPAQPGPGGARSDSVSPRRPPSS